MLRRPRLAGRLLLALSVVLLLLGALTPAAGASGPAGGVALTLGSDGSLHTALTTVVPNGSALRYAMDGDFAPLVATLPVNGTTRASLLATINATENNPLLAGLFGDHDGRVDATVDVPRFQSLILNEAKLIPLTTITGAFNVTLDGNGPSSQGLQSVSFSDAVGPDTSPASMGVTATLVAAFSWNSAAASHVFQVAWKVPSIVGNLTIGVPSVNLSFATPSALDITLVTGLNGTQISNDLLGWGGAQASGQYDPRPGNVVVVHFGPAFPTGDALILGAVAVVAGLGVGWALLRRRRRRRTSTVPPSVAEPGVGPSSGSG